MNGKIRQIVQILMVDLRQKLAYDLLDFAEIHHNPALVQSASSQYHFDLPVVSMEILAFPSEVSQIVRRGKIADYLQLVEMFHHGSLVCKWTGALGIPEHFPAMTILGGYLPTVQNPKDRSAENAAKTRTQQRKKLYIQRVNPIYLKGGGLSNPITAGQ
jgi:hypothetical protein